MISYGRPGLDWIHQHSSHVLKGLHLAQPLANVIQWQEYIRAPYVLFQFAVLLFPLAWGFMWNLDHCFLPFFPSVLSHLSTVTGATLQIPTTIQSGYWPDGCSRKAKQANKQINVCLRPLLTLQ